MALNSDSTGYSYGDLYASVTWHYH